MVSLEIFSSTSCARKRKFRTDQNWLFSAAAPPLLLATSSTPSRYDEEEGLVQSFVAKGLALVELYDRLLSGQNILCVRHFVDYVA